MQSLNNLHLVLGGIASTKLMQKIREIDRITRIIEVEEERLDNLTFTKYSMELKLNELKSLGIETAALEQKINDTNNAIITAAQEYINIYLTCQDELARLSNEKIKLETEEVNCYNSICLLKGNVETQPLYYDSIKMNSNYFSFKGNSYENHLSLINDFIRKETGKDTAITATSQIQNLINQTDYQGSLIITAICTHQNVHVFTDIKFDPYEMASIWNETHPEEEQIVFPINDLPAQNIGEPLTVVRGIAYGSNFVGIIHFFSSDKGSVDDLLLPLNKIKEKLQIGSWLNYMSGDFGVENSILSEVRSILVSHNLNTRISLIINGAIAGIKSKDVKNCIPSLNEKSSKIPEDIIEETDHKSTYYSVAKDCLSKTRYINAMNKSTSKMLEALANQESETNKVIDLNSLLTAFDNYQKALKDNENTGIPIHYYTQPITRNDIILNWLESHKKEYK